MLGSAIRRLVDPFAAQALGNVPGGPYIRAAKSRQPDLASSTCATRSVRRSASNPAFPNAGGTAPGEQPLRAATVYHSDRRIYVPLEARECTFALLRSVTP